MNLHNIIYLLREMKVWQQPRGIFKKNYKNIYQNKKQHIFTVITKIKN